MKNLIKILPYILFIIILFGCKKATNSNTNIALEETINNVLKQEPIGLSFGNENSGTRVKWTWNPATNVTISSVNNNATIIFTNAGNYTVEANDNGVVAKYYITVKDEMYNNFGTDFNVIAPKFYKIKPNEKLVFQCVNVGVNTISSGPVYGGVNNVSHVTDNVNKTVTVSSDGAGFIEVNISNGIKTIRRTVWVDDEKNPTPNKEKVDFVFGDKLLIEPSVVTENGITYIKFTTTTNKKYHCSTDAILSYTYGNNYMLDFAGVDISTNPCSGYRNASCINKFKKIPLGTYPFTVNFKNQTFNGSLLVNATGYHFTWDDTSVVDIKPRDVM